MRRVFCKLVVFIDSETKAFEPELTGLGIIFATNASIDLYS